MIIHISALTNECGMKLKPDLEKVKYCEVECNLETVLDYHVFAEITNELVGHVNLDLDTLEMIPSCLLRHTKAEYIAKWPTGQLFHRLNFY